MFQNSKKKNRRHLVTTPFAGAMIAHDNRSIFNGVCTDISVWGLSFSAEGKFLSAGSEILIHLRPGAGLSAFNAVCELVSVSETVASLDMSAPVVQYTVRFISMTPEMKKEIDAFAKAHEVKDVI